MKVRFNGVSLGKTKVLKKANNLAEWNEELFPFVPLQSLDSSGLGRGILEFSIFEKHVLRGDEELEKFQFDLEAHPSILLDQPIWLPTENSESIKLKFLLSKPTQEQSSVLKISSADDIAKTSKLFRRKSSHNAK